MTNLLFLYIRIIIVSEIYQSTPTHADGFQSSWSVCEFEVCVDRVLEQLCTVEYIQEMFLLISSSKPVRCP